MPTLITSLQHRTGSTRNSSQIRKTKGIQIGREEVKLSLYAHVAHGSSQARDQIQAGAATYTTAAAMLDP